MAYYETQSSFNFKKAIFESTKGANTAFQNAELRFYEKHLGTFETYRIIFNKSLDNNRFDRIISDVIVWPKNYGVAATTTFFIYKDSYGNVVNDPSGRMAPFFLTIIPQDDETFVQMSYFAKDKNRYEFLKKQIIDCNPFEQKILITNLLAMYVENFFISPPKWKSIPHSIRTKYLKIFEIMAGKPKPKLGFYDDLNIFFD